MVQFCSILPRSNLSAVKYAGSLWKLKADTSYQANIIFAAVALPYLYNSTLGKSWCVLMVILNLSSDLFNVCVRVRVRLTGHL